MSQYYECKGEREDAKSLIKKVGKGLDARPGLRLRYVKASMREIFRRIIDNQE
jgi:hypothetical protein